MKWLRGRKGALSATRARRLSIATMVASPLGPKYGGPGSFVAGLLDILGHDSRFELSLIAPDNDGPKAGKHASQIGLAARQLRALVRIRPDVVHTHEHPVLLAAAIIYREVWAKGARVVHTVHFDSVEPRPLWKRLLLGALLRRCAAVTVMAQASASKFGLIARPTPKPDQIHLVRCAATLRVREKSDPEVRAFAKDIGHLEGPTILQVSNFVYPAKVAGTLRLLEAFPAVRHRFANAKLLLLGTGPLLKSAQEYRSRLGLADAATIPGRFIEDLSLPVGLADLQCHISLQDSCPIALLEAMHAGKAIVASRAGGIPELITDQVSGLLTEDNPEQIAAAIIFLLEHPDKAMAMGNRARQIAALRFSWERVARDFARIYEKDGQTAFQCEVRV